LKGTSDFKAVEISGELDLMCVEFTLKKEDKKTWRIFESGQQY
jgi:hypothetical protein